MIILKNNEIQQLIDHGYIWYKDKISNHDLKNIYNLSFPNANSKNKQPSNLLTLLQPLIKKIEKGLSKHFNCKFIKSEIWDDVDEGSKEWHNDNVYDESNSNLTILIYCDKITNGNSIEIRGPISETKITPDKHHMIFINQNKKFQHKASIKKLPRRVVGFQYLCEELKWI